MDHAGVVVEDLAAAIAFFVELGLELEGEAAVEGEWVDQLVGLTAFERTSPSCGPRTATAGSSCRRSTRPWPPALRRGRR
jgi:catechol 2,3-dioxygenase-like lactoylglutathione lyase family enzyme